MIEYVGNILTDYFRDHDVVVDTSEDAPIRSALLAPYIEQRGIIDKIYLYEAEVETDRIVATIQKFKGETGQYSGLMSLANIYYAPNHNYCWRRFGVCKEMYHCMIDRSEDERVASVDSLRNLIELLVSDTTALTGDFPPLDSEQEAEFLALETLFPVEYRMKFIDNPINTFDEFREEAKKFRIPIEYATIACQPSYIKTVARLRGRLIDV